MAMGFTNSRAAGTIGTLLCRGVVPLWILTGAVFKLVERDPKNLPKNIVENAMKLDLDLFVLLRTLIGLEFLAAGVMLFVPRLSRVMALFMLSMFCLILIGEMATGNITSCGCFGKVPIAPWQMLIIDGLLLTGVILFKPRKDAMAAGARPARWPVVAALVWIVAGFGAAFGVPDKQAAPVDPPPHGGTPQNPDVPSGNGSTPPPVPVASGPGSLPLPKNYLFDQETWAGKKWEDLKIARIMKVWPKDINVGKRYVVFYSRTCDHCRDLFQNNFTGELVIPTTVVAIPEEATGFATKGVLPMPCTSCEKLELPIGPFWYGTPPIVVALEDGVVKCAQQITDVMDPKKECLPWEP